MGNCISGAVSSADGGSGGGASYTNSDNTVRIMSPETIETTVGGNIRVGVFNAKSVGNGEISVAEADYTVDRNASSRKYELRTYETKGAYIDVGGDSGGYSDNRDGTTSKGINWDNVKAVSGGTYSMRTFLKSKGFKWDGTNKKWIK